MKSRTARAKLIRRLKYSFCIVSAIGVAALMFYLNVRHENNLQAVLVRGQQIQEQFHEDVRFRDVIMGADSSRAVSTITGHVASQADLDALEKIITTIPPFAGTYKWVISVEIRD